jgi:prepilin-type N-terminal cleavage/methylation domain-containing protein
VTRTDDRKRGSAGFTLVELLTVIAIVGILATLLLSVLATAKKKGRIAVCTSNLRQSVLAYEMYRSDFPKRPSDLAQLVASRHLSDDKVLLCPEDRTNQCRGATVTGICLSEQVVQQGFLYVSYTGWGDNDRIFLR